MSSPTELTETVQTEVRDGIGYLRLDRTKAINALTTRMLNVISASLSDWHDDPQVREVHISGLGERGYSSGADVRGLYDLAMAGNLEAVLEFLAYEYGVDAQVANFPKPITTYLHGVSMGGGLGVGTHRGPAGGQVIASADLKWAMPEVGIGLWPDVGMCYQLAKAPGEIGAHLAMTGATIDAASALYAGLVDQVDTEVDSPSQLEKDRAWIDECYQGNDPVVIVERLHESEHAAARQTAQLIETRNPVSVHLALEALRRAEHARDVHEVLAQDLALARTLPNNIADFVEGVRAQLVDKDRNPQWSVASLDQVDVAAVQARFHG